MVKRRPLRTQRATHARRPLGAGDCFRSLRAARVGPIIAQERQGLEPMKMLRPFIICPERKTRCLLRRGVRSGEKPLAFHMAQVLGCRQEKVSGSARTVVETNLGRIPRTHYLSKGANIGDNTAYARVCLARHQLMTLLFPWGLSRVLTS